MVVDFYKELFKKCGDKFRNIAHQLTVFIHPCQSVVDSFIY